MSVVFDFNDSLIDSAPLPQITLSVYAKRNEEFIVDGCNLCAFLSFVFTAQIEFHECSI